MKKLLIPLSLITLAMIPTGCNKTAEPESNVAKNLSSSLTEMMQTVNNFADIDESKLTIDEINSTTDINKDYAKNTSNTYKSQVSRSLLKAPKTTPNGKTYYYNRNATFKNTRQNSQNTAKYGQSIGQNVYKTNSLDNTTYPNIANTPGNYVTDGVTSTNRYYTAQYTPRHTNTMTSSNSTLTNYFEKIQDLYTICNDTCAASYELEDLKSELIDSCKNCNTLLAKVNNGEVKLTQNQVETLNEYNNTLKSCISDLKTCKGCENDVEMISTLKGNFSNNCDTLVAKYLKVLNNLDTNTSICNNARCTVAEVNNYISSICGESNVKNYNRYDRFYNIDKDFLLDNEKTTTETPTTTTDSNKNDTTNSQSTNTSAQQNNVQSTQNQTNVANDSKTSSKNETQNNTSSATIDNQSSNLTSTQPKPATSPNNYVKYPVTPITTTSTQNNQTSATAQNNTQPVATQNTTVNTTTTQKPSTYPMSNPNNNRFQNTPQPQDFPNKHPLTKDIKENPNAATKSTSAPTSQTVTYYDRYDSVRNSATPTPKRHYEGIATNGYGVKNNTLYKSNTQKMQQKLGTPINKVLNLGPQGVRANKNIMTLEEL